MTTRIYRQVWGVAVGDLVRPGGGEEREVWTISGPYGVVRFPGCLVISPRPLIDLMCVLPGRPPGPGAHGQDSPTYLNGLRSEGGRLLDAWGGEVVITPAARRRARPLQMGLFGGDDPSSYDWQGGVDYAADGRIWHCERCTHDFNAPPRGHGPAWCSACDEPAERVLVMDCGRSALQRALGVVTTTMAREGGA